MFLQILNNITLIVALVVLYRIILVRFPPSVLTGKLLLGLLFGVASLLAMSLPVVIERGLIFDSRSILIAAAGLFSGFQGAIIAVIMSTTYRIIIGGPGMNMGVAVILASAGVGIGYHYLLQLRPDFREVKHFYLFGLIIHLIMIALMLLLQGDIRFEVFRTLALPIILLYPLGTALVCKIIADVEALHESDAFNRILFDQSVIGLALTRMDGQLVDVNPAYANIIGRTIEETLHLTYWNLTPGKHAKEEQQQLESLNTTGHYGPYEKEYIHKDGHLVPVRLQGSIIERKGEKFIWSSVEDITKRKRAEEALRESEEKYRLIINNIPDVTWTSDAEGRTTYISPNIEEVYGYTPEEIFKDGEKLWFGRVHPDDLHTLKKSYNNLFEQDMEFDIEYRIRRKDGQWIWLHDRAIMHYEKDKKKYAFGVFSDITKRKQAEKELHKLSSIVEQSFEGIALADLEGNLTFTNSSWNRMHNYEPDEELIGKHLNIFHNQEQLEQEVIPFNQEVMEIGFNTGEVGHIRKDGTPFPTLMNTTLLKDKHGKPYAIAGMAVDISDRKRGEQVLAESAEKYRLLFENINDAVAINQNGKYVYFNRQFRQMLGYATAEMDHKDYREVFSEEGLQILAARQQIRERGEEPPARYETSFVRKDGQLINIEANVITIVYEGQPAAYAVLRDITERKRAEAELAESLLSAKQANSVKDQFIANISHEIRTPLNSIIGFSDLFQQRYGKMVSEKDQGIFQYITNSSDRLMRTVDSILNISQLDAGSIKIEKRELDLNYIVRAVIGEVKSQVDEKGLEITYIPTDQQATVLVDNYSTHQAILNIIGNAIKYTLEGKIDLKLIQKKDSYRLSIQDTGIGISEEYQNRIFEPYTQESEGFTKSFQGIGLGLALTKRYLELNGVELELESEKNGGSTFTLIFPKYVGTDHV